MHNLAIALHNGGHIITGSDDQIFEPSRGRLALKGLLPEAEGWYSEKVHEGLDAIILGMHARADNPELARAQELELPIFSYPEFLYEISKTMTRVVIAGSHGKTTTTVVHPLGDLDGHDYELFVELRIGYFSNTGNHELAVSTCPSVTLTQKHK